MKKLGLLFIGFLVVFSSCKEEIPVSNDITETITTSTTWTKDKVYVVDGTISVVENQVLTIEPGTTVKFTEGSEFDTR